MTPRNASNLFDKKEAVMGALIRKRDGAWCIFRKPEPPIEVLEVTHPGLVAAKEK